MITRRLTNAAIAGPRPWCIAGGFAACPGLAADVDVWIFVNDDEPDRSDILATIHASGLMYVTDENDPDHPADFYDVGAGILCWKVAKLADGRQIILTNATDVPSLLENFDVSTHQVALTGDGELVKGSHWTPITEPPVQLRQGVMTEARMIKIAQRYKHFVEGL